MIDIRLDVQKIRARRETLHLTQEEAARRAKLAGRAMWCDFERNLRPNVTIKTLAQIMSALEYDNPMELLTVVRAWKRKPRRPLST